MANEGCIPNSSKKAVDKLAERVTGEMGEQMKAEQLLEQNLREQG